jgi:hypothetical protein
MPAFREWLLKQPRKIIMEPMSNPPENKCNLPGMDYLALAKNQEDECEEISSKNWKDLGVKASQCLESIGIVLFLLESYATCIWDCKGGDHILERLVGRTVSSSRASLRLLQFGFYDESLSIIRNIGEIANLILLFSIDNSAFDHWMSLSQDQSSQIFKPSEVRKRLQPLGKVAQINGQRYGILCKIGTHPSPNTVPQRHSLSGKSTLGGYYQAQGALLAMNELAIPLMYIAMCLPKIVDILPEQKEALNDAGKALASSIGGVNLTAKRTQKRR